MHFPTVDPPCSKWNFIQTSFFYSENKSQAVITLSRIYAIRVKLKTRKSHLKKNKKTKAMMQLKTTRNNSQNCIIQSQNLLRLKSQLKFLHLCTNSRFVKQLTAETDRVVPLYYSWPLRFFVLFFNFFVFTRKHLRYFRFHLRSHTAASMNYKYSGLRSGAAICCRRLKFFEFFAIQYLNCILTFNNTK